MNNRLKCPARLSQALLIAVFSISACSNQTTLGERMINQGADTVELGNMWREGNQNILKGKELVANGNEMIKEGNEMIDDEEDRVSKGEKLLEKGQEQVLESEINFKNRFPDKFNKLNAEN